MILPVHTWQRQRSGKTRARDSLEGRSWPARCTFSRRKTQGRRTRTGNEEWSVFDSLSILAHLNISRNEADRPLISIPLASTNRSQPRIVFIFALPSRDESQSLLFDLSRSLQFFDGIARRGK